MRNALLTLAAGMIGLCGSMSAQSAQADSLIAKYIQASGGSDRIQAIQTLRRTGKFTGGGGFEAVVVQESSLRRFFTVALSLRR